MGFDGTVIDRIPNAEKLARQATQELEFMWHASSSDPSLQIFTHCMDEYLYWTCVRAYAFHERIIVLRCSSYGLPISLPKDLFGVKYLADEIVSHVQRKATWQRHPLVLFPFGVDFAHFAASWDFGTHALARSKMCGHSSDCCVAQFDPVLEYINANSATYGVEVPDRVITLCPAHTSRI